MNESTEVTLDQVEACLALFRAAQKVKDTAEVHENAISQYVEIVQDGDRGLLLGGFKGDLSGVPMEREDGYVTNRAGKIINKSATYACALCGRCYLWELGVPGLKPLFDEDDFGPPEPAWKDEG